MEQTRLLFAIALSLLVLIGWNLLFPPPQPVAPPPPIQQEGSQPPVLEEPAPATANIIEPALQTPEPNVSGVTEEKPRQICIKTPLYTACLSEMGGGLTSVVLSKYRESVSLDSPPKQVFSLPENQASLLTSFATDNGGPGTWTRYQANTDVSNINISTDPATVSFFWTSETGMQVEKKYRFDPQSYMIDLDIFVKNGSTRAVSGELAVALRNQMTAASRYAFEGPAALVGKRVEEIKLKSIAKKGNFSGEIGWVGITGQYFMQAVAVENPIEANVRMRTLQNDVIEAAYVHPPVEIRPGAQQLFSQKVFCGPKSLQLLNSVGYGLGKALSFGWFSFIAKPCLWLMNWFYGVIPNYGLAIIFLTLLVKAIMWPLGNKSYQSMAAMKKLQPLMNEIREKYKDDKQKMNEEVFALYRTYKVNPMSGCLPMVLQIPVFIALYRMLYGAIELRHTPFVGWITDLSAPDRLFSFGFSIPFMEPPYGIPVLTVIMGASMFFQQKMAPPAGDPMQAKMMMALPIVFTVIFINFPSGLVLYWLINNIVSMAQQYYVSRKSA